MATVAAAATADPAIANTGGSSHQARRREAFVVGGAHR
jgi:hypothetical protein